MHSALFPHPGLSVTDRPAIKRESIPTLLSKGLVPPTDRIILEIQKLCNLGAGFALVLKQNRVRTTRYSVLFTVATQTPLKFKPTGGG